ncbi:MAG TPA: sigma-70 family RNA polymerase sigma factor [Burkholderiales bacterium]
MSTRDSPFVARLRRYARALAGPGAAPDELVRETLERAGSLPPGEDRESRIALFTLMHEIYAQGGTPERTHEFDRAISALPPEQREVFLLVTVEEMSYEDVAKTLGIPIGTVMSRLYRAREKLRAWLLGRSRLKSVK